MAQVLLRSLGTETLRLVVDLTAPLVVRLCRLGSHCRRHASRLRPSRRAVGGAVVVATVLLAAAAGVALLYSAGADLSTQTQGSVATGEPLRSGPVKMVDAAPRSESCDEQVWPYIEQRCLRRATATPPRAAVERPAPAAPPPTPAVQPPAAGPATELPPPPSPAPVDVTQSPAAWEARGGADAQAAVLAGAAAGAAAIQTARPDRRAERRRSMRRSARRQSFPFRVFGLRF